MKSGPGANEAWLARSQAAVWHPCTQMQHHARPQAPGYLPLVTIARGNGPWLYDFEGRRYLDGISSWWTNLFGHANPRINAALREQLETLEHVMLAGFTHQPVVELSERLSALTAGTLGHAFYASDGASATDDKIDSDGWGGHSLQWELAPGRSEEGEDGEVLDIVPVSTRAREAKDFAAHTQ
jgi:adenosylmethionine-8-amino-7-oxononanoate aminotransferase